VEEQIAAGDALLQVWGQGGVVVAVEVVEAEAAARVATRKWRIMD
jgi:hypothetical protein